MKTKEYGFLIIRMRFHFLSGRDLWMDVNSEESVSEVKRHIQKLTEELKGKCSLLYNGIILDDSCTLQYYGRAVFCS